MKIVINKNVFETIINNTSSYIEKKDSSSITSHILISAKDGLLHVKATDYEIGLSYKINEVRIVDEGYATANGKKILDIIKALKDEELTLETMNNYLYIRQKGSKYKLPMYNPNDFPEFPTVENKKKFEINSMFLSRSMMKISSSIDINNANFALNGALVDVKKNYINLVGTDTKRLSIFKIDIKDEKDETSFIIPKKAITEMQKIFYDNVEIYYDENILIAVCQNYQFYTKLINGKFPDYQRVIPNDFKENILLPRDKFLSGMRTISMVCDKMKLIFKENSIIFESISEDNSEARTEIECKTDVNSQIEYCITNRYILDFLQSIEDNSFEMKYNDFNMPILLKSGDLITVVMPTII